MASRSKLALALVSLMAVIACTNDPEPPHNERYFDQHADARAAMLERCAKDQNTENPLNCVAAENSNRSVLVDQSLHRR